MDNKKYTIDTYGKKSTFASFLPAICGIKGSPLWCYYVNRGQCVVSFGSFDKDHSIMEFFPAHQAYENVKRTGFRTFIKENNNVFEIFSDENKKHKMDIFKNSLEIEENDEENNINANIKYFVLPNENIGAIIRKLTIKNTSKNKRNIQVLDGMPELIPYGVDLNAMKTMGQTVKAWMQVEDIEQKVPYFRVRVSMDDTASVKKVEGGNFSFAMVENGEKLSPIVDTSKIFEYDTSLKEPVAFKEKNIDEILKEKQITQNSLPCSFFGKEVELLANESFSIYQVIGQVENKDILNQFLKDKNFTYFEERYQEATKEAYEVCKKIETKTANPDFDEYCKYTFMDNILRGGMPIKITGDKNFYVYSRKHGDLERDYNFFTIQAKPYSQGNGNYRDVNQNRRCDNYFYRNLGTENIKQFYDFVQLDGYNPLVIEQVKYSIDTDEMTKILATIKDVEVAKKLEQVLLSEFTPGDIYLVVKDENILTLTMEKAKRLTNGRFGEGYWSDHFTYNLDLIESYLNIYPEKEEEILFDGEYNYFKSPAKVNKREKRYVVTENGLRQYKSIEETEENSKENLEREKLGKGDLIKATLVEKLILLNTVKFATLDAYGMGIEMEGGKPGWYDALNGLPGIFGSSMAETYELKRNLTYTINILEKFNKNIKVFKELHNFINNLDTISKKYKENIQNSKGQIIEFWNEINNTKEEYRENIENGIVGEYVTENSQNLANILKNWAEIVDMGINKGITINDGFVPTYFYYNVTSYEKTQLGYLPTNFETCKMPYFLEGVVRYLKIAENTQTSKELYTKVLESDLYDKKLKMYKVNASLNEATYEIGRAKAFTPGWLENESIWLHMEYKYLLEVLKSGLYSQFFKDFKNALVPFLDENIYGRSILENSSFIASSANPDEKIHGKGFVARLSGSTIEFVNMWHIIMFGKNVFTYENGELNLNFAPAIPEYLIDDSKNISATFMGEIKVNYYFDKKADYFPNDYKIEKIILKYKNNEEKELAKSSINGAVAEDIRELKVSEIYLYLKKEK